MSEPDGCSGSPTSPGTRSLRSRSGRVPCRPAGGTPAAASSTCPSGRPVDPTPDVVQEALRRRVGRPGLPADVWHARPARGRRRLVRTPSRGARRRPRGRPADRRIQGARRLAADPARAGPGDVVASRGWPTPPTTSGPGWRARRPWPSTRSPPWARHRRRRRRSCCGSTLPATPPAGSSASSTSRKVVGVGAAARRRRRLRRVLRRARLAAAASGSSEPPTTPSILDPRVTGGSHEGLLCRLLAVASSPTSPATGRPSSRATRRSSAGCSRCASTPG